MANKTRTVVIIKKITTEYKQVITTNASDEEIKELFENGELDNDWKELDGTTDSEIVSIDEVN